MAHVTTFFLAIDPRHPNEAVYQKTIGINDWYTAGPATQYPLGNVQGLGKLRGPQAKLGTPRVPLAILDEVTKFTLDLFIQSEDLPLPENRVTVNSSGQIVLTRRATNMATHEDLIKRMKSVVRKAGFPVVLDTQPGRGGHLASVRDSAHGPRPGHQRRRRGSAGPRPGQHVDRRQFAVPVLGGGQSRAHRRRIGSAPG